MKVKLLGQQNYPTNLPYKNQGKNRGEGRNIVQVKNNVAIYV